MGYVAGSGRAAYALAASSVSDTGFVLSSGSNRKVVVGFSFEDAAANGVTISGATFNSVAMTRLCPAASDLVITTTQRRAAMFYMDEADLPVAGTYTVAVSISGSVSRLAMYVMEFEDMATGGGVVNSTTGTDDPTLLELNTTTDNATVAAYMFVAGGSVRATWEASDYTPTELVDANFSDNGAGHTASQGDVATAATVTVGADLSSPGYIIGLCAAALAPYSAGGTTTYTVTELTISAYSD